MVQRRAWGWGHASYLKASSRSALLPSPPMCVHGENQNPPDLGGGGAPVSFTFLKESPLHNGRTGKALAQVVGRCVRLVCFFSGAALSGRSGSCRSPDCAPWRRAFLLTASSVVLSSDSLGCAPWWVSKVSVTKDEVFREVRCWCLSSYLEPPVAQCPCVLRGSNSAMPTVRRPTNQGEKAGGAFFGGGDEWRDTGMASGF